jgi:hypothetical protein
MGDEHNKDYKFYSTELRSCGVHPSLRYDAQWSVEATLEDFKEFKTDKKRHP